MCSRNDPSASDDDALPGDAAVPRHHCLEETTATQAFIGIVYLLC